MLSNLGILYKAYHYHNPINQMSTWATTFELLFFQNMVVRYGAINDHDGEEDTEVRGSEDNISENSETSTISLSKYKTILAGKT